MKRLIFLLLIGVLLISISKADNGFCFVPNLQGKVIDNWSNNLINSTIEISSYFGETPNGYPPYCMTNISKIRLDNSNFKINDIIVASTGENCSLKYEIRKFGYLEHSGYFIISSNQKNYSYNIYLKPNTLIRLLEYGTNKSIDGKVYVNGNEYKTKNGSINIPLTNDIVYIFYKGDNGHDSSSNITTIDNFWKENIINYFVYRKPNININFYQNENKTNVGEEWDVYVKIKNTKKFSSPTVINYSINGCGIKDFRSIKESKNIKYITSYNNSCEINLDYLIFDEISKQTIKNTITLSHEVSNKYNISYFIKNGYVYAKVLDVNGNPIKTNISIEYNGHKINMKYNGTLYYSKIPGNSFSIEAKKDGNAGLASITGNFIREKPKIDYSIISLEIILGIVTVFWIYKSRKLKK